MKKVIFVLLLLCGCHTLVIPDSFSYKEIETDTYKLASWQKITDAKSPIRIYIEGDGYAFNHLGYPTTNPTPHGTFLREVAFQDPNPNVVYLGRACQYVTDEHCVQKDWTTGRFSQDIVDSAAQAVMQISMGKPIVLIGYSGGALLSGLVITQHPEIPVKKWITIAGVLNHTQWTENLKLPPLSDSVDLHEIPSVPQLHLLGDKDPVVPYELSQRLLNNKNLILVPKATHNGGFESYDEFIY